MFGSSINSNDMLETVTSGFSCTRGERVALITDSCRNSSITTQAAMLIVTDMVQANATQITPTVRSAVRWWTFTRMYFGNGMPIVE
jgi:hypothetical protein